MFAGLALNNKHKHVLQRKDYGFKRFKEQLKGFWIILSIREIVLMVKPSVDKGTAHIEENGGFQYKIISHLLIYYCTFQHHSAFIWVY